MKVELRINGAFHLELTPETPTETLVVNEMLDRAAKGKTVSVVGQRGDDAKSLRCLDVSVEC
jgi:hypothetical protein